MVFNNMENKLQSSNEDIISRIRYLMNEMHLNQGQFARRVEMDATNMSKHLNGKLPINDTLINKIAVNLGVSREWLRYGKDLPFAKDGAHFEPGLINVANRDLVPTYVGTPVYDIDVAAGYSPRAMMFSDDNIVGNINLPAVAPNCRIVQVSGDSMTPIINSGDMVAIREIESTEIIFWGQIYVVILDDYRLVKYLRKHDDPSMVILRSENPNYDDIEVPRSKIRQLFLVQNVIRIDSRL